MSVKIRSGMGLDSLLETIGELLEKKREPTKVLPLTPEALVAAKHRQETRRPLIAELRVLTAQALAVKAQLEALDALGVQQLEAAMPEIAAYSWETDLNIGTVTLFERGDQPSGEPEPATAADAEVICRGTLSAERARELLAGLELPAGRKAS